MIVIEILLCTLAVYGAYSIIIDLRAFLCGKARIICAVRVDGETSAVDISSATAVGARARLPESEPVLICQSTDAADRLSGLGYETYVRYK